MDSETAKLIIENWDVFIYLLGAFFTFFGGVVLVTWRIAKGYYEGRYKTQTDRNDFLKEQLETYVSMVGPLKEATKAMIRREKERQNLRSGPTAPKVAGRGRVAAMPDVSIEDAETTATATANVVAIESFEDAFLNKRYRWKHVEGHPGVFEYEMPEPKSPPKKD